VTVKRSIPIVFVGSSNPVEDGYVAATFEAAAETLNIEPNNAFVHRTSDLEAVMSNLGQRPDGGLVVASAARRLMWIVILLAYYEGFSREELAERYEYPVNTIRLGSIAE